MVFTNGVLCAKNLPSLTHHAQAGDYRKSSAIANGSR
jgi:hypothetical protein